MKNITQIIDYISVCVYSKIKEICLQFLTAYQTIQNHFIEFIDLDIHFSFRNWREDLTYFIRPATTIIIHNYIQ